MFSYRRWREKYGKITVNTLWDLFMVWVVIINLSLILFDLTYLWLRPTYFTHLPIVTRIWDPVLGIEPHPLTEELIEKAATAEQLPSQLKRRVLQGFIAQGAERPAMLCDPGHDARQAQPQEARSERDRQAGESGAEPVQP